MPEEQLSEILSLLSKLDTDIRETNKRLEEQGAKTKAQFKERDERHLLLFARSGGPLAVRPGCAFVDHGDQGGLGHPVRGRVL